MQILETFKVKLINHDLVNAISKTLIITLFEVAFNT